jgi:hypothetical protein
MDLSSPKMRIKVELEVDTRGRGVVVVSFPEMRL